MNKLNIALLAGGNSSERGISLQSAEQIYNTLDKGKYNIFLIDVKGKDWLYSDDQGQVWQVDKNDFSITLGTTKIGLDYALILIHGTPGEDGELQGYLDMMGVPYSSCGLVSSAVTFDKQICKKIVSGVGVNVAKEIVVCEGERVDPAKVIDYLGLPMFVKPNASGSSFGVTKVHKEEELLPAIEKALKESDRVLVEEFIDGCEVSCGILVTRDKEMLFPVTEIVTGNDFFDFEAKYKPGLSDEITPARISDEALTAVNEMTLKAYKACSCKGIVRIDFIIKKDGTPVMIEINTVPGMSAGSIVPKQAACMGVPLGELFDMVIEDTRR